MAGIWYEMVCVGWGLRKIGMERGRMGALKLWRIMILYQEMVYLLKTQFPKGILMNEITRFWSDTSVQ